jgi:GH24 family phage-related lysozyme (muramidase)
MISDAIVLARELLVKPFEGYGTKLPSGGCAAYPDPGTGGHPWTIGWGSTGADIHPGTTWTLAEAEHALDEHLLYFATGLLKLSPSLVNASDRRVAALISFCYNCGLGNYRVSTLKKRADNADWLGASEEILKWNKAAGRVLKGLTRRREAEAALLK